MSALQKIDVSSLKEGDEVVVYGGLRRMFKKEEQHTFTGHNGKVHRLPLSATVETDGPGVWVKVAGIVGQFYATEKHVFKRVEGVSAPASKGAVAEGENPSEKPAQAYKYIGETVENAGVQELRKVFAGFRAWEENGQDRKYLVKTYVDAYFNIKDHDQPPTSNTGGVVQYGFATKGGRYWTCDWNGCYSGMRDAGGKLLDGSDYEDEEYDEEEENYKYTLKGKNKIMYVVNYMTTKGKPVNEAGKAYLDWLMNESPWAVVFVTKTAEEAIATGAIVDASYPNNLVTSACIATRWTGECRTYCDFWYAAVQAGMNPHDAMWMSNFFYIAGGEVLYSPRSEHTPFGGYNLTPKGYNNYIRNIYDTKQDKYCDVGSYSNLFRVFDVDNSLENNQWYVPVQALYTKFANAIREQSDKNPFGPDVRKGGSLKVTGMRDFIPALQQLCDTFKTKGE